MEAFLRDSRFELLDSFRPGRSRSIQSYSVVPPLFGQHNNGNSTDLRATHPHGEPQALHDAGRLAWGSGPHGEAPAYTGTDVIIVRDGKIAALYVFLDSMPS
jgi:hypothetical protein